MLKYVETLITFSEFPDEISLCINISNCPNACVNCHSSYLKEDIGTILDYKELDKLIDTFYKKDDIYYYKDKECTKKVKGLLRSKKKMNVKGGVLIKEQPYQITDSIFIFAR